MFKKYFKTAWRNLGRSKMHSFINIAGLSIGMSVAILIGLWIYDELSFDKSFRHYDHIAQVMQNVTNNGEVQTWSIIPFPLAEELRRNYGSDFKQVVLSGGTGDHILSLDANKVKQNGGFFDKGAADMFSLTMEKGNRNSLDDPSSLLLSSSAAQACFGNENPLNRLVKIDNMPPLKVTGVYKDFQHNSTFADLHFIGSWEFFYDNTEWVRTIDDPWRPNAFSIFVRLNDNANLQSVSGKIKDVKLKKVNAQLSQKKPALFLQPMSKWHLYAEFKNGVNTGGAIQYVWMFGITGVFVLLLACINFMNLSTARNEKRAREVGVRKTLGSSRRQLIIQFFTESFLTVLFAFVLSVLLVQCTLPFFNQVADKQISILWKNPYFWLLGIGFALITALVAGSYPAFYLSSFEPVKVLKGTFKAGRFAALPRKTLVVLQFTVSVTLIIGTIIVHQQIQFAKNRPVGYTREGLISIPTMNEAIHKHLSAVKEELLQTGTISSIAESGSPTTGIINSSSGFSWNGKDPNQSVDFGNVKASYDYGKTIGWKITKGRDFSRDYATDSTSFILNEAAVHFMGLKNPVGEKVSWFGTSFTVIGVVSDMVMESPYNEPRLVVYNLSADAGNVVIIRINPAATTRDALNKIEAVFKKTNPEQPFEYKFTDEVYAGKFGNEERIGKLASLFALLAIAISCLGLFGLTSFVAEQRKREIGVRKVLGASVFTIWNLLSRDFVVLVVIAFMIAVPVSHFFMHHWLQNYHYRTHLSWWIFASAGAGSLLITIAVVSFQSVKAAIANPVKSLKTD